MEINWLYIWAWIISGWLFLIKIVWEEWKDDNDLTWAVVFCGIPAFGLLGGPILGELWLLFTN